MRVRVHAWPRPTNALMENRNGLRAPSLAQGFAGVAGTCLETTGVG